MFKNHPNISKILRNKHIIWNPHIKHFRHKILYYPIDSLFYKISDSYLNFCDDLPVHFNELHRITDHHILIGDIKIPQNDQDSY